MIDYGRLERQLVQTLPLQRRPIAIAFREAAPVGTAKFSGTEPSGCSFWRLAMDGRVFYTVPGDHHNCPLGSHTHNMPLPRERASELQHTLSLMMGIGYVRAEEVPEIPRLPRTPGVVIYAPLADTPVDPDVVLFAGRPRPLMLLHEAALRAGIETHAPLLGRPTCMALPASLAGTAVASTGCIGNRVYTDLGDDELYVAVPGKDVARIAAEVGTIAAANATLLEYHRGRRQTLATD